MGYKKTRMRPFVVQILCSAICAISAMAYPPVENYVDTHKFSMNMQKNLSILMITVGSRGDVQYWIPICSRLVQLGHRCTLGTHERYRSWITEMNLGINFVPIAGDPAKLMVWVSAELDL